MIQIKLKFLFPLICATIILLTNCEPSFERFSDDPSLRLNFSDRAIVFDTLFTEINSITRRIKVYNSNKNALRISEVYLGGGESSPYGITILGQTQKRFENIEILGEDSLLVLVSVNIDQNPIENITLAFDSLMFSTNGNLQDVKLVAWGENTIFLENYTLTNDETFTKDNAYLIAGNLEIPANRTLTIADSSRIYFYDTESGIEVNGNLEVLGERDKRVLMAGFRRETEFENNIGQWKGIQFNNQSTGNINFTNIRNAQTAIEISQNNLSSTPDLNIRNTSILHQSEDGIRANQANIYLENTLIANCLSNTFESNGGGTYDFRHCTIANYEFDFLRNDLSVVFKSENSENLNINIQNSIFWGNKTDEIEFQNVDLDNPPIFLNLSTSFNIFKTSLTALEGNNNLFDDPLFEGSIIEDFRLTEDSPAKDSATDIGILRDLRGTDRDAFSDRGAFEFVPE